MSFKGKLRRVLKNRYDSAFIDFPSAYFQIKKATRKNI